MPKAFCLSLAFSFLLAGAKTGAQSLSRGRVFRPAPIPHNQFWGARPMFPHPGFFLPQQPSFVPNDTFPLNFGVNNSGSGFGNFGFFPNGQFFFHHRFGVRPFFPSPFGFPFYGFGNYGYAPAFVSPFGPGPYGAYPAPYGYAPSYASRPRDEAAPYQPRPEDQPKEATRTPNAPEDSEGAKPDEPASSGVANPDAAIVTLDGQEQPSSSTRSLIIGSGRHTLRISPKPARHGA